MTIRLPRFACSLACGFAAVLVLTAMTGCGGSAPSGRQAGAASADELRARMTPRDDFEAGREVPISADTHFAAGQFAEGQGNLTMAMDQYAKALKLDPKHKDALFRTGVVQVKQRTFNAAIDTFNRYVAATGGEATAYASLGFAYELSGRITDAENAYRKGVQRDPMNAACRVNYGLMLARKERFNEARVQMQTVLSEAEVHYNMASVYESLGRKEQAKLEYRKAIELEPAMRDAQARLDAIH